MKKNLLLLLIAVSAISTSGFACGDCNPCDCDVCECLPDVQVEEVKQEVAQNDVQEITPVTQEAKEVESEDLNLEEKDVALDQPVNLETEEEIIESTSGEVEKDTDSLDAATAKVSDLDSLGDLSDLPDLSELGDLGDLGDIDLDKEPTEEEKKQFEEFMQEFSKMFEGMEQEGGNK